MYPELELTAAMQPSSVTGEPGVSLRQPCRLAADPEDTGSVGSMGIQESEEVLIVDSRARFGPAQQVEHKLSSLLCNSPLPNNRVRATALFGGRRSR